MPGPTEDEIRTRAFDMWKAAGSPEGDMDRFWYEAEQDLLQSEAADRRPVAPSCEK